MKTKLIELEDGTLLEIDVPREQVEQIAGGVTNKVNSSLNKIKPILINVCNPITETWNELNDVVSIEKAEIELGLSFEAQGNVYVTKAKAGANLTVKLVINPKR